MDKLVFSRQQAARARLFEDKPGTLIQQSDFAHRAFHRDSMLRHGVLISPSVTPGLETQLNAVCSKLSTPRTCVSAFVYNSPEVQADCLIDSPNTCVLRLTSGLINLLSEPELRFVIGHELGHFLFGHGACSQYDENRTSEGFLILRARELSADRIGYLAGGSLNNAIKAIIKTASGLGDEYLRFDVSSFLSQAIHLSHPSRGESRNSTHPSMLIRCRGLLWFSMKVASFSDLATASEDSIRSIDQRVVKDLETYVDGQIREKRRDLEDQLALWESCLLVIDEGALKKSVQERLAKELGDSYLASLMSFLEMFTSAELREEAETKLLQCRRETYSDFPNSAREIEDNAHVRAQNILGVRGGPPQDSA